MSFHSDQEKCAAAAIRGVFHRRHPLRGVLLAFSHDRMPHDLLRGEALRRSIKDSHWFDCAHSANICLRVDRETRRTPKPNRLRQGTLAYPDRVPKLKSAI
jgi:hypothetical protein